MKIVLRRNDQTSIFCGSTIQHQQTALRNTKVVKASIACVLLITGAILLIITR